MDLHVATHYIRARQPSMLTILDGALSDARTLTHRIIDQEDQRTNRAGATNPYHCCLGITLPIEGGSRLMGSWPPDERPPSAIADQDSCQYQDQEIPRGSQETRASSKDMEPTAQNKVPPPDPIFTNSKLGLKRLPTLTVWTTNGK